jgi:hypothetical protein
MRWHYVQLTSADIARGRQGFVLYHFENFFKALKAPSDMAIFITSLAKEPVRLYFSPSTARSAPVLLQLVGAEPCDRPTEELALLAGQKEALEHFRNGAL